MSRALLILLVVLGLASCRPSDGKNDLLPLVSTSDSAVVLYYREPGEPRFFRISKVYRTGFIDQVAQAVNRRAVAGKATCITQGKIHFYRSGGAVETIYFSRADSCRSLSFIKTGEKYVTQMPTMVLDSLNQFEKRAVSLSSGDSTANKGNQ
jgi:hypothetical protein